MVCLVHQLERGPVLLVERDPGWQPASYGVDLRGVQREKVVSRETCEVHLYSVRKSKQCYDLQKSFCCRVLDQKLFHWAGLMYSRWNYRATTIGI